MKILDVICAPGKTGFFFDDQRAIKQGAGQDGFVYRGEPVTPGFHTIRQAGESISVMLLLEDGQVAHGDCAAVQYSGAGGRDPLFLAEVFIPLIEERVKPVLLQQPLDSFRSLAEMVDKLQQSGRPLHTAIRYGVTQALLDAVAKAHKCTMAEVIQQEYHIRQPIGPVPIFTQSGDDRYQNVDKMILKGADVIPHGLINQVETKLGTSGEKLKAYVGWLRDRLQLLQPDTGRQTVLHIDVYGTIGLLFSQQVDRMADYLGELEEEARPYRLRIEGPMDMEERGRQVAALKELRQALQGKGIGVEVVADEWCNTLEDIKLFADEGAADMIQIKTPDLGGVHHVAEAILYCKERGIGAYCGGTCNETDRSAQVCTQIAMACGADQCLAKPGMGVDEGFMIVHNEMSRVMALVEHRRLHREVQP